MAPTDDDRQTVLAAVQRLESATGRREFAADQIAEELRRTEPDAERLAGAIAAMTGGELLESGTGLLRRADAGPETGPGS